LEKVWGELMTDPPVSHSDPNNWRPKADIRPSGFPFCPRKYVFNKLGYYAPSTFNVKSNYYTEIGKAVHYVAQNAFARTGRLFGKWKCAYPQCRELFSDTPSFLPKVECPHCNKTKLYDYEELIIEDHTIHLKGHTDGVLVFKDYSAILEIKTAGNKKVEALRSLSDAELSELFQTESPWYGYWHQASTYLVLVQELYGEYIPPLREIQYLVFSRDSPDVVASVALPVDAAWYAEIQRRVKLARKAAKLRVLPEGFAHTQTDLQALPSCTWCDYKDVCLNPRDIVEHEGDALTDPAIKDKLSEGG
jgi:hypothetical protein